MTKQIQRISPFLWFDQQAEEAARFYVSIFPNSTLGKIARYSEAGPGPKGNVMTVAFAYPCVARPVDIMRANTGWT